MRYTFTCAHQEMDTLGAPARAFPLWHGCSQVQQPIASWGKAFPVYLDIPFRADIDDFQQKGKQAAVPTRQNTGIECHSGYIRR